MSIDTETARRVAKLARIKVEDADLPALASEFNTILGFIEQLGEVDVDGVEPMTSVTPMRPAFASGSHIHPARVADHPATFARMPAIMLIESCARPKRSARWMMIVLAVGMSKPLSTIVVDSSTSYRRS